MTRNKYLLLLNSQYSHEKSCIELLNVSDDPGRYVFDNPVFPDNLKYGTYDYRLFRCVYDNYEIAWRPDLNDSVITVFDSEGVAIGAYRIADMKAESGMLEFRPESPESPYAVMESAGGIWIYGDK